MMGCVTGKRKGGVSTRKERRPYEDLLEAYRRTKRLLEKSCARFDEGDRDEAFVIALLLRSLLHYGQQRPLLYQIGIIKKLNFVDTGPPPEGVERTIFGGLARVKAGADASGHSVSGMVAKLDGDVNRTRPFTPWWKSDRVIQGSNHQWHTRHFLVTQVANKDVAHFDPFIEVPYKELHAPHTWSASVNGMDLEMGGDVVTASLRQIGWEVLQTLNIQAEELLRQRGRQMPIENRRPMS